MEIESFYRTVLGKIDAEVKHVEGLLASGSGIADWVTYQRMIARRDGILAIRKEITDIWGDIFRREPVKRPESQ